MSKKFEIIAIMDRSASMHHMIRSSVDAFNEFISEQVDAGHQAKVTLYSFDTKVEKVFDRVKVQDLRKLTVRDVNPRGMTALHDAVGQAITEANQDKPTIVLIQTDGGENSSTEYNGSTLSALIEERTEAGWTFKFIGAGIDAQHGASQMGIKKKHAVNVAASARGMADYSTVMSTETSFFVENI